MTNLMRFGNTCSPPISSAVARRLTGLPSSEDRWAAAGPKTAGL